MSKNDQRKRDLQRSKEQLHLFYQPRLTEGLHLIDGEEAHHLKVLRTSVGDKILVTNGRGTIANCVISSIQKNDVAFSIGQLTTSNKPPYSTHIFVAPTKNSDRIEWLVEKATEIGVRSITLVDCTRSERRKINHERLLKMAVSAMKQSQQAWLPEINPILPFDEIIKKRFDQNFIAFVDYTNPDQLKDLALTGKSYALLIGPEGDFTDDEIKLATDNNWKKVSLGPTRLRTETAALAGILTLVLLNN